MWQVSLVCKWNYSSGQVFFSIIVVIEEWWWHLASLTALLATWHHPIWWKIQCWTWSRHTSEMLDHTTQLGFLPPDFLPVSRRYSSLKWLFPYFPVLILCSPVEASSLLFLLQSDIFELQRARDEANVTAFLHQATNPPVVVVLL